MAKTISKAIRSEILNDNKLQEKKKAEKNQKQAQEKMTLLVVALSALIHHLAFLVLPASKQTTPFQNIAYTTVVESD